MGDVPSLVETVSLLAQGVGIGAVLAFLFEQFSWFQELSSRARWWLVFVCSVGLPVAARAGLQLVPAETWALLEPYWRSLALGFLTWAGSQAAHWWQSRVRGYEFVVEESLAE